MGSLFPPGDTKLLMPQVSSTSQSLPGCHKTPQVRLFLPQPPRSTRRRSILSVHRGKFRSGAAGCHGDGAPLAIFSPLIASPPLPGG